MMRMSLAVLLCASSACDRGASAPRDFAAASDLAVAVPDLAAPELAAPDLAAAELATRDLAVALDLTVPLDLSVPPDLIVPPDLTPPPDLTSLYVTQPCTATCISTSYTGTNGCHDGRSCQVVFGTSGQITTSSMSSYSGTCSVFVNQCDGKTAWCSCTASCTATNAPLGG